MAPEVDPDDRPSGGDPKGTKNKLLPGHGLSGRLGRRSPLYHPFLLILIAGLVLANLVQKLIVDDGREFTLAAVHDGQELLVVSSEGLRASAPTPGDFRPVSPIVGRYQVSTLDGDANEATRISIGDGFAFKASARGDRFQLLFGDRLESLAWRSVGPDDKFRDEPEIVRTLSLDDESRAGLAVGRSGDEPLIVALSEGEEDGRLLQFLRPSLGTWIERDVAQIADDATSVRAAVAGGQRPIVIWAENHENGCRLRGAVLDELAFRPFDFEVDLAEGNRVLGLQTREVAVPDGETRVGLVVLLEAGDSGRIELWELDPAFEGNGSSLIDRIDLAGSRYHALGPVSGISDLGLEGVIAASDDRTAFLSWSSDASGQSLHEPRYFAGLMSDLLPRSVLYLALFLPAVIALVVGIVLAFRKPIISEPPLPRRPAPLFRRAAAFFVDAALGFITTDLIFRILGREDGLVSLSPLSSVFTPELSSTANPRMAELWQQEHALFLTVAFLLTTIVAAIMESRGGRTPGKMLVKIRVTEESADRSPSFQKALSRRFLLSVDLELFTIIFAFLSPRCQRLGDIASRTMVIDELAPPPEVPEVATSEKPVSRSQDD